MWRCTLAWAKQRAGVTQPTAHWTEEERARVCSHLAPLMQHIRLLLIGENRLSIYALLTWPETRTADRPRRHGPLSTVTTVDLVADSAVFAEEVEPTGAVPMELSLERYRRAALLRAPPAQRPDDKRTVPRWASSRRPAASLRPATTLRSVPGRP